MSSATSGFSSSVYCRWVQLRKEDTELADREVISPIDREWSDWRGSYDSGVGRQQPKARQTEPTKLINFFYTVYID